MKSMEKLREGSIRRLTVEGYAADGAGVGRLEGVVVFVTGGVRGEACDVLLEKVGRSACWGRVVRVAEPSPARAEPDCPYAGVCGGCQFRHVTYAEELEAKRQRVEDAFRRIGGLDLPVSQILGAQRPERYRNKVQLPVAEGREGPKIGFFRARSHDVVDVADCLLQPEAASAAGSKKMPASRPEPGSQRWKFCTSSDTLPEARKRKKPPSRSRRTGCAASTRPVALSSMRTSAFRSARKSP